MLMHGRWAFIPFVARSIREGVRSFLLGCLKGHAYKRREAL